MLKRRSSSDCGERNGGFDEGRRGEGGGRIWSLPINDWRRRLSKFGVVELEFMAEIGLKLKGFRKWFWGFEVFVDQRIG